MIDPGSCLRANVILSPPSSVDLNQFSEVSIERRQEDGFTTVRKLSSDQLAKLTSKHIIAPIGPGTYRIKSTTAAGSVEQFLDVVLDFRPACDDWTFGADGSLTERIEILEVGEARSAHDRGRDLACVEERWQRLYTRRERTDRVCAGLDRELRCSSAQIPQFEAGVLHDFPLHTQQFVFIRASRSRMRRTSRK